MFDSGHPDVLFVTQQQIKSTSNTSMFIKYAWLHISILIRPSTWFKWKAGWWPYKGRNM